MGQLILKTRLVSLLPSLDTQEFPATVEAWCEVLSLDVPIDRLNDSYLYAMRHRNSSFPLSAVEVLEAWRIINAEEFHQQEKTQPCRLCFGAGFGNVYDPKTDTEILKECPHCNGKIVTDLERVQ